jgi:hypothetical protein
MKIMSFDEGWDFCESFHIPDIKGWTNYFTNSKNIDSGIASMS